MRGNGPADVVYGVPTAGLERPSEAVVRTVARASGVDPLALDPLYGVVDPDALDALFESPSRDRAVEFDYQGFRVRVQADAVDLRELADR